MTPGNTVEKKTIKMMMEQTNSTEDSFINNVRPFWSHFYLPTFLLFPIIFKIVQKGSCYGIIRQLSQICQAFIAKVIRQLSRNHYSQVPNKRVGWEKVRVGWKEYTFFLSLFLSFCMLPYSHFFHPTIRHLRVSTRKHKCL